MIANVANPEVLDRAGMLVRLADCPTLPVRGFAVTLDDRPRDVCGRPRSSVTWPKNRSGLKPGNHGRRYPATPPTEAEALAILAQCASKRPAPHAERDYALIVFIWRTGARISEALSVELDDLNPTEHEVFIRNGKGSKGRGKKPRYVAMDRWGWDEIQSWLKVRPRYPGKLLFPVVEGRSKGGPIGQPYVRTKIAKLAEGAGVDKRVPPHQWRHGHLSGLVRDDVPLHIVQRQAGHSNLAVTTVYLSSISGAEVAREIMGRPAPGRRGMEADPVLELPQAVFQRVGDRAWLRERRTTSMAQFAAENDIGTGYVSQIEGGQKTPPLAMIAKVAAAYGMEPVDMFQRFAAELADAAGSYRERGE